MNQNPEQLARDAIDTMLTAAGWFVQSKKNFNLSASNGVTVWEYSTSIGSADNIHFINKQSTIHVKSKRRLIATPDNRTFGYFNQNLVCDYGYQKAVEDGVLVPYNG